jgi:2,4-dienoyl-CoA reductase-like NADH-dependent reductase (Old Yellow Enzyme family)
MPRLFDPLAIKDVTLRNRIGVSPMCMYASHDGHASDWHLVHLGSRAVGGAGLVMCEATAVTPSGRISPRDAGIWSDAHIEPLLRINRFIKEQGALPGMQLAHAGRKGSATVPWEGDTHLADDEGGWPVLGPSPRAFGGTGNRLWKTPRESSTEEISEIRAAFASAAKRTIAAGYEWLELHFAHGYLVHEFLTPLVNRRDDGYGGSLDNRMRLALEVTESVRAVWPERLPLAVRISATDWVEGGWTVDDSVVLARALKQSGVDLIDCSSGHAVPGIAYPITPGYQVPAAERIRREAQIATAAVGVITEPVQADSIIREERADLVFLAMEYLRDPYWPLHAAVALDELDRFTLPPSYEFWIKLGYGKRTRKA